MMDPYEAHGRLIKSPLDQHITKKQEKISDEAVDQSLQTTMLDHLTDLRKQLIKSIIVYFFFFAIVLITVHLWFPIVTREHELTIFGPFEVITFYMSMTTTIAFGLSLPFLCYFLWQFMKPGLQQHESRFLIMYAPLMFVLFIGGTLFGYFVIHPFSYEFLMTLGAKNFELVISAQQYARYLLMTTIPMGFLFQLPIVALFLSAIGWLQAESMRHIRKWSYVLFAVLSALLTPPDFISQLIVLIPMIGLYEISILFVKRAEYKRQYFSTTKEQPESL